MKMPITKRIATATAIVTATADEITSVKVKAKRSKHRTDNLSHFRLTAVLSAILATSLFTPNAVMAAAVNFNNYEGQGSVVDGIQYDKDGNQITTGVSSTVYGWYRNSASAGIYVASKADISIEGISLSNVYGGYISFNLSASSGGDAVVDASSNKVTLTTTETSSTTTTVTSGIYGGYTGNVTVGSGMGDGEASITANGNEVNVSGSAIRYVEGARTGSATTNGAGNASIEASGNKVTIENSTMASTSTGYFYGAYTGAVNANGTGAASVIANENSIEISGESTLSGAVSGAYIYGAVTASGGGNASVTADGNSITLKGEKSTSTEGDVTYSLNLTGNVYNVYFNNSVSASEGNASVEATGNSIGISESNVTGIVSNVYVNAVTANGGGDASVTLGGDSITITDSTVSSSSSNTNFSSAYIRGAVSSESGNVYITVGAAESTGGDSIEGNSIKISGSSVSGTSTSSGANNVSAALIYGNVTAGEDAYITVNTNSIEISGKSSISGASGSSDVSAAIIYGTVTAGEVASVTVDGNSITITEGSSISGSSTNANSDNVLAAYVRGDVTSEGDSASVEANKNSITISGSTVSGTGSAVNSNNVAATYIYGAVTASGGGDASVTANGNSVTVSGSTISGNSSNNYSNNVAAVYIYGAVTSEGGAASVTATGNSITISDSTISGRGTSSTSNNVAGAYVYYGGTTIKGDKTTITAAVDYNEVSISGSTVEKVYGGAIDGTISASSASGVIITASASNNVVSITDKSSVSGDVIGGYVVATGSSSLSSDSSISVTADYNQVTITDSTVTNGSIAGGYSNSVQASGTVSYNTVEITNTAMTGSYVYAGYAQSNSSTSDVTNNQLTITDSTLSNSSPSTGLVVAAGYSQGTSDSSSSELSVTANNVLTINGGDITANYVIGGWSRGDNRLTEENEVYLYGATVTGNVYGGCAYGSGDVINNIVTMDDYTDADTGTTTTANITGNVSGGWNEGSGSGNVANNTVTLTSGTITGNVYGGYREYYDSDGESGAVENTVTISSKVNIDGNAFGGYVRRGGIVTENEITLTGGTVSGDVSAAGIGSLSSSSINVATGNTATLTSGTVGGNVNGVYAYHDVIYSYTYNSGNTSPPSSINVQAYTNTTSASSNEVVLTDTDVAGGVYGVNNVIDIDYDVTVNYDSNSDKYEGNNEGKKDTVKDNPFVISADITDNTVTINGGTVGGVYAASSSINSVYNSSISYTKSTEEVPDITDETATIAVNIKDNTVQINSVEVTGDVCGAYSKVDSSYNSSVSGFVTDNTVTVTVDIEENTVNLDGGNVTGNIYGAYDAGTESSYSSSSEEGSVSKNTVTVDVKTNKVNVNSGVIKGDTFAAGYSAGSGTVSGNEFNINGGTLSGGLTYAGYSNSGAVSDNTINLNGGTVSGTLYAGYSESGTVQNNTINLDGANGIDVSGALLFGSSFDVTQDDNGNTLNIKNFSGRLQNIGNFDTITIDLTGIDIATAVYGQGSVIILTDSDGNGTNLNYSTVNITSSTIYNSLPVVFTSESELSAGYTIVANANGNLSKEGTTITEQILFVQDPNIYENPQYVIYDLMTDPADDGTISYGTVPEPTPGPGPADGNDGKTVQALGGIGNKLSMHDAQLSDLRRRLGEVRYGAQDGLWARYIYQRNSYDGVSSSSHAKQNMHALNLGLDHIVSKDENNMWLLGGNFQYGHDNEKVKYSKGKGNLNSYGLNLYATYANQYGCYADLVLTYDNYHQKIGAKLEDNSSTSGKFNTWGWGASIEVGKMFSTTKNDENRGPWNNHWWIEPQAQLSYYWIKGKDWSMKNGLAVKQHNGDSLVGRLGVVVGKQWNYGGTDKVDKRYVQAYLKGGVKHEFLGNQKTKIGGVDFNHKLRGTSGYYGAGVDWNLAKRVKAYAQVEKDAGGRYKRDIEASIGLKWQF